MRSLNLRVGIATLVLGMGIVQVAEAQEPCTPNQEERGTRLASIAGQELVQSFGGGRDVEAVVQECTYLGNSEQLILQVQVDWNGALMRRNHYMLAGELQASYDGADAEFRQTDANDRVQRLSFFRAMAGQAIELGVLLR